MKEYNHNKVEKKWQSIWDKKKIYQAKNFSKKPKYYGLIEFPYPSGDGLHVGHPRPYIGMDIISRKRRMQGFNVLYPIGWDAFGLPAENYAIKTGIQPSVITKKNADNYKRQMKNLGLSFDWSREIYTTDPKYYKWTQWIFLQFFKKNLAYKAKMMINWCPKDKIGLANEEVVGGACERCGTPVEKREKEQWMLAITKYASRLDKDLDNVDYLPQIKLAQRNWIGKSEGAEIEFSISAASNFLPLRPSQSTGRDPRGQKIQSGSDFVKVFTTRPDTLYGATYIVLAPEHEMIAKLKPKITNWSKVLEYILASKAKNDVDRTKEEKDKTGVEIQGVKAINPATGDEIPIWIADYVLVNYGTGAIMAVPAHDGRDFEFAKKYDLPIMEVIIPKVIDQHDPPKPDVKIVERKAVQAIVINPKNKKVLCLKWKKFPWTTFVTGGIENNEDIVTAAKREIAEETGYLNVKYIRTLGGPVESHFYASHKGENRKALFHALVFELENDKKKEVSDKEKEIHEIHWMSWDELEGDKDIKCSEYEIWLDRFFNPEHPFMNEGILINSGRFDGLPSEKAKKQILNFTGGKMVTKFKLRDWIFSRQRYWGEPIPVISCPECGLVPVPERDLPVELPKVKNYQPTDSGESPLANIAKWVNVKCPKCKGKAKRETDTMPNWAGSSWYYLRYTDPQNAKEFASQKNLKYWTPVDWYNGGNEHTTLHLLYSRFWHKFLFDLKLVPTGEPYMKRTSHGLILAAGGEKMSKSKGNVINPDDIVKIYGADTLRLYEMFMGPFNQAIEWSDEAIIGPRRFLEKVWRIGLQIQKNSYAFLHPSGGTFRVKNFSVSAMELEKNSADGRFQPPAGGMSKNSSLVKLLHKTIKKVSEDIEAMHFNTAISAMMILSTEMEKTDNVPLEDYKKFLQILAPFAPHITEELWSMLGEKDSISLSNWPSWYEQAINDEKIKIAVQVDGKVRAEIDITTDANEEEVKSKALANDVVLKYLKDKNIKRIIYVKNRLINIVL